MDGISRDGVGVGVGIGATEAVAESREGMA